MGVKVETGLHALPFGNGEIRRQGKRIALIAFGTLLYPALDVGESLNLTVVNMRWAKPLDTELLAQVARRHDALVTLEEGTVMGGAGSAVLEALQVLDIHKPVLTLGIADVFTEHGDPVKLMVELGLDAAGIRASISQKFPHLLS